jgi:hypothetical protein
VIFEGLRIGRPPLRQRFKRDTRFREPGENRAGLQRSCSIGSALWPWHKLERHVVGQQHDRNTHGCRMRSHGRKPANLCGGIVSNDTDQNVAFGLLLQANPLQFAQFPAGVHNGR